MSAGQVWRRPDGLRWVEVQAAPVEVSGWRLMIPLVALDEAPDAPPLVVTVGAQRGRVHLLCSAPDDELGELVGELGPEHTWILQAAVQRLVAA